MKTIIIAICGLLFFGVDGSPFITSDSAFQLKPECAKGPVLWCKSLESAKACGAVTHCIQTVWEKQTYPEDHDSICQICLDMVKQARDQLRSNETMQDLKAVFEGTCEFIRIKKVRQQCDKLADDMVPELVEALSSQMNPQVVCSVSGLCNNAAIDKELAKHANEMVVVKKTTPKGLTCSQCNKVSNIISTKFANKNRDEVLENMLSVCGQMSSLSDGCSAIVLAYFNEVYSHLKTNLNSENICHMAGVCADQFHQHEEDIEVIEDSRIGYIQHENDDIPCDLCKQLIVHLRDLLVANTTESEFKNVLEGICKQTKTFKSECLSLADQYYDLIYAKLTKNLDPDGACFMIGICPKGLTQQQQQHSYEIAPLVPNKQLLVKKKLLGEDEPVFSAQQIQSFQLPRDVLLLSPSQLEANIGQQKPKNDQFCTLCEYFLHFVQDALASPVNEDNIKKSVMNMCKKVKKQYQSQCQNFVDDYADAVIAMLIQEIDPSQVCPKLLVCKQTTTTANEKCPLCLFLVQDLEEQLQRDHSKKNIEDKLNVLCDRLRDDLKAECQDFIHTYTAELVDKLANDFTPRDICLYLKCCTEKEEVLIEKIGDKASFNDYITNTIYEIEPESVAAPECLLCEELVKSVEKRISKDKSRAHIKEVLKEACSSLPKASLKNKCLAAIEKETDSIINLILKEVTPKEVCMAMGFCFTHRDDDFIEIIPLNNDEMTKPKPSEYTCRVCQIIAEKIEEQLNNKTAQQDVENCVKQVCVALPSELQPKCKKVIDAYADEIIKHLPNDSPKDLCKKVCLCDDEEDDSEVIEEDDGFFASPECVLCEQLVKEVEKKVKNDKSKEHIKEVLEEACSKFHKQNLKEKCIEVVEKNADYIVSAIIQDIDPKQICHGIGFCDAKPTDIEAKIEKLADQLMKKYTETPQCVLCQLIATKLEADLKNNKTEEQIENVVRRVCHSLPNKFSVKCKKFVEDYADLIISLVSTVPPKELCAELNLCLNHVQQDTNRQDVMECGICHTSVDALSTVLEKHGPKEKDIVIETTCHLLPAKYYDQCHEFLKVYGISVTNLVKRNVKRSEICVQVGKCFQNGDNSMFVEINGDNSDSSSESIELDDSSESHEMIQNRRLIGADNKCTYGPSYWCSSDEAMKECNAHNFCNTRFQKATAP